MSIKTLLGLPAHPLIVHAAVVLVPLVALGTILIALWPPARRGVWGWIVAGSSIAAFGFVGLAQKSGGSLANHVPSTPLVREHVAMGDAVLPWAFVLMGVACSVMALQWYVDHRAPAAAPVASGSSGAPDSGSSDPGPSDSGSPEWYRPVSIALGGLALLAALGGTVQVYRVGHSGAKATWSTVDMNGPSTGGGEDH